MQILVLDRQLQTTALFLLWRLDISNLSINLTSSTSALVSHLKSNSVFTNASASSIHNNVWSRQSCPWLSVSHSSKAATVGLHRETVKQISFLGFVRLFAASFPCIPHYARCNDFQQVSIFWLASLNSVQLDICIRYDCICTWAFIPDTTGKAYWNWHMLQLNKKWQKKSDGDCLFGVLRFILLTGEFCDRLNYFEIKET